MVVDDSDDAAVVMASLLKHSGHEAVVAHTGEAALQQASLFRPDVMFIDLSMPGTDGFSVARQLRQTAEFAEMPLVAVSGHTDAEHRTEATSAGFTEFLAKPYLFVVLEAVLDRVGARLAASRNKVATARRVAEQTRQFNAAARQGLDAYWRTRRQSVPVTIEKSGISVLVTMRERSSAEDLRQWLKAQRCRVGPTFEPDAGQFGFYCYSKRRCINDL
ncbi:MAG TPA: response regulator [Pirellulales bacterium]|nr:response regulator [Pirellulales bacterium]